MVTTLDYSVDEIKPETPKAPEISADVRATMQANLAQLLNRASQPMQGAIPQQTQGFGRTM